MKSLKTFIKTFSKSIKSILCKQPPKISAKKNISILLGAGFSANKGYPIGSKLNNLLLNCDLNKIGFHTDGRLMVSTDGKKPSIGYKTSYDINSEFCLELFELFNSKRGYFDYEEFYDFLKDKAESDSEVQKIASTYFGAHFSSIHDLLFGCDNILNQLISHYIKDKYKRLSIKPLWVKGL
ncbi:MAG: hypothetical protein ABIQ40_20335 [Bacteroidia bacterium]